MDWIGVPDYRYPAGWNEEVDSEKRAEWYCQQLEQGEILFFDDVPFSLPAEHQEFLLAQRQTNSRYHKNVSYRPKKDMLRGVSADSTDNFNQMRQIMRDYSKQVTGFVSQFLAPYANGLALDFASFRPLEEQGRDLPLHKRNDLLHVDSFPTRPTKGGRILRVFTNINPDESRIWNVTDRFDVIAEQFAMEAGLNKFAARAVSPGLIRRMSKMARSVGIPVADYSPYDEFMLRFHDFLKENTNFQTECKKTRLEFPPQSTWLVYTDGVPHAALSGQFALEHTYIIPVETLVSAPKSPIRILEKLCEQSLSG